MFHPTSIRDKYDIYLKLASNKLNMIQTATMTGTSLYTMQVPGSIHFGTSYCVILAPNLVYSSVAISPNVYLLMTMLPVILMGLAIVASESDIGVNRCQEFANDGNEVLHKLKSRIKQTDDYDDCFRENVQRNQPSFCMTYELNGKYVVKQSGLLNGIPIMKVTKLTTNSANIAFPFERGSPYIEVFNLFLRKIVKSGIPKFWKHHQDQHILREEKDLDVEETTEMKETFLEIISLSAGRFISMIVFTIEFYIHKCTQ
ncbi:hypothetical protein TSAR_001326 [Trichomalopsis sarcophagae]|uniref:Uncharacterized protein n=1 Tax=Trichomalopsis sarcophagae TaxID=543379 RepID=A0A232F0V9_9HYME|nr:hypothetical protein TSAR_001326 [Trichomalopsis sarcophagae]